MTTIANEIELEPFTDNPLGGKPVLGSAWPFLGSVKVRVSVRVGGADTSVAELLALKSGAVLTLDTLAEEPLDVLVDGHVVARGTLVAVGDYFGVRITETASASMPAAQRT
jgi:flagellar motor switch protein FliN/FliY